MDAAASGGFACRTKRSRRTAKSCGPGAATVASILREDIPQTTVTKNAAHRGEHEVSRKAIARGKPGCLGGTCSRCPCAQHMGCPCAPAHGIYGRSQRPAFPAPFHHERDDEMHNSGENHAARMRALAHHRWRPCERRDPYAAAGVVGKGSRTALPKQPRSVVIGPCVGRDDKITSSAPAPAPWSWR